MALLSYREVVRQPICLILAALALCFTALLPVLVAHTLDETARLVTDSALAVHLVTGLLLAGIGASASIHRDIKAGTAMTMLSKPVTRISFFLSRFLGIALFLLVFSAAMTALASTCREAAFIIESTYQIPWRNILLPVGVLIISFAAAGLINYLKGTPFTSAAMHLVLISVTLLGLALGRPELELLKALLLLSLAILVLTAAAVSISPHVTPAPAVTILALFFLLGMISDYLVLRMQAFPAAGHLTGGILPHWQFFWVADALHAGTVIPLSYLASAGAYAAAYGLALLSLGAFAFNKMEIR